MIGQVSSSTSDTLAIMWTTNIIAQVILKLFEILEEYPNDIENELSMASKIFELYEINDAQKFAEQKIKIKTNPQIVSTFIEHKLNLGDRIKNFRGKKRAK